MREFCLFSQPLFDIDPEDVKVQLRRCSTSTDTDRDLEGGLADAAANQRHGGLAAVLNSLGGKLGE